MSTNGRTHLDSNRRHDAVLLFDVTDGNPNGDPDAGNLPRVDPETMQGLVTDVAIKRKVRDYVDFAQERGDRYRIYIQGEHALNDLHQTAYDALDIKVKPKQPRGDVEKTRQWMCDHFYDVRTFGAVMSTGVNAGQVRGPVQLTFARSIDSIIPMDLSITRIAITKPGDMGTVSAEGEEEGGKRTEMGRKAMVPYGLYRGNIFVNPKFGVQTGFDEADLELLWRALINTWDLDRSASRGMMAIRGLYVFSHENGLGNAPAHQLLDRIHVQRKTGVTAPRLFSDYEVSVDDAAVPEGVTLTRLIG